MQNASRVGALDLRVHPALVPKSDPLAHVDGALNAVAIQGEMVGPSFLSGLGAGAGPTATSVAGDIIDIAKNSLAGAPLRRWHLPSAGEQTLQAAGDLSSRYYLRFTVRDESGVLAALSGKLSDSGISIEQMVQDRDAGDEGTATIAMLTHHAREGEVRASLNAIDGTHLTTAPHAPHPHRRVGKRTGDTLLRSKSPFRTSHEENMGIAPGFGGFLVCASDSAIA